MLKRLTVAAQLAVAAAAIGALVISWNNGDRIQEVHVLMNSRLTELLEVTRKSAMAAGVEKERGRQEQEGVK